MLTHIALGAGILFAILLIWAAVVHLLGPQVRKPDGKAQVVGKCGTIMDVALSFREGKLAGMSRSTTGCAKSMNCLEAVSELAMHKTPEEIARINPDQIQDKAGGLPRDDMDCAVLAHDAIKAALSDYLAKPR